MSRKVVGRYHGEIAAVNQGIQSVFRISPACLVRPRPTRPMLPRLIIFPSERESGRRKMRGKKDFLLGTFISVRG